MEGLQEQLDQLERHLLQDDITNKAVSKGSAHWHVHHSLKVVHTIITALSIHNKEKAQPKRSMLKSWILLTGYIPRGKARAPKKIQALEEPTQEEKVALHHAAQILVDRLSAVPSEAHFLHPHFGSLYKKDSIRFLRIHTHHHLKIINDIKKNA